MKEQNRCYIVAEIGINHNGDIEIAKQLINVAKVAGCDAVKFQKRTPEICTPKSQWNIERDTPWGRMTYIEYKHRIEFGQAEYDEIDRYCKMMGIAWYASAWDIPSVEFLQQYEIPYVKIGSASATDAELVAACITSKLPLIISTGMCDAEMIDGIVQNVQTLNGTISCLYHCTSTYPSAVDELNLLAIKTLQYKYPDIPIGYSGHEAGLYTTLMAAVLGAVSVERHITLDRTMWGTDQSASLEPTGINRLVRDIRIWERARGDGVLRIYESELPIMKKLRRI